MFALSGRGRAARLYEGAALYWILPGAGSGANAIEEAGAGVGLRGSPDRGARPPGRQCPGPLALAQGADGRRLLARGRPDLLARARAEAGLRPRGAALVVHGDAQLVRLARAPRP